MPTLKHLNSIDYVVIIFFLAIIGSVGIFVSRYNRNTKDYFKAGGKLPWLISSLSLFVSGFSAFMFVSASGFTYRYGVSAIYMFTSAFGAYWLGYFVYGKLWRRTRIDSPMQVLTRRFSQSTTYFYSIIAVVPNVFLMGTLIYTLSIFVSSALGFGSLQVDFGSFSLKGFELITIGIGAVLLLYTVLGGLWAVAVTDTLQFIILFLMTAIVFPFSFIHLGNGNFISGVKNLFDQAPSGYLDFSFGQISLLFVASFWLMNCFGYNVNWHIGQRYYSIADERDTKKMAALCAVFGLIGPLMWIMPVMVARVIFPDMASLWPELTAPSEASFVTLCLLILPNGFLGVVVSAILAASMSSADSTFNWLGAVVTKDVYVPISRRLKQGLEPSERNQLIVGKMTVLIIGALSIIISLYFQKIGSSFDIYMKIYSMTTPAMFVPVMLGMVYRKTPWWSGMASASIGITFTLIMNAVATVAAGYTLERLADVFRDVQFSFYGIEYGKFEMNIFLGVSVTTAAFLLTSRWRNKNKQDIARAAAFEKDLQTPAYGDNSAVDKESIQSYKIVALLSGLIGVLLIILSILTEGYHGFLINFLTGLGAIIFCGLFWFLSKRYI